MNGARALLATLVGAGVDTCFSNPGTSEMHFVAALDAVPEMRGVLTLFEGVATGAADGYARMAEKPAATLLHLGPGLGNGLANLHNARRARTPLVNIVGDHATYHARFDAPLQSDIASLARPVSGWYRVTARADDVGADAADAVAAAYGPPGCVATLVLPADASWSETARRAEPPLDPGPARPSCRRRPSRTWRGCCVRASGRRSSSGGPPCAPGALHAAGRISRATGAPLLGETFPARLERGAGIPAVDRLGYLAEFAQAQLAGVRAPGPGRCQVARLVLRLPGIGERPGARRAASCTRWSVPARTRRPRSRRWPKPWAPAARVPLPAAARPDRPSGALTAETLAAAIGAVLPEHAIVVDEGITSGLFVAGATAGAPPHDWLTLTGGAIGIGLPAATGAAVAAPDRPVLCLQADGSAMYTLQALWTQARERLDVTTVVLANRSYAILHMELQRVGAAGGGTQARRLLDLTDPELDFVALSQGMGVPGRRVETAEELTAALRRELRRARPHAH